MTMTKRNGRWLGTTGMLIAAGALMLVASTSSGYNRYYDGCQNCHGAFDGSASPKGTVFPNGDKHYMHRSSSQMDASCGLCHSSNDNDNPWIGSSSGTSNNPGYGCVGCHGRDYGGSVGVSGVGLRQHHVVTGITSCGGGCHPNDPAPLPENVKPPYYGTVDTNADDPCNNPPDYPENWSIGDTFGLDNDGDNLYDLDDPDCGTTDCPGDLDGDLDVDQSDLGILLGAYNLTGDGDLDGDGDTDQADLGVLLANYGLTC